ncbi:DEAD/DEAH box helicase family protein [Kitasatospora sp. NPDC001159]
MPIELRDHQIEAVDAIIRALDIPPGGVIPANGLRAQIHAACGTGKTYISAAAARRLVPRGRVLVLVPTLALLGQTIKSWREVGHTGPAVAVCSMEDDVELWSMDVRCTTNPIRLAMWHGSGPVTIFATYSIPTRRSTASEPVQSGGPRFQLTRHTETRKNTSRRTATRRPSQATRNLQRKTTQAFSASDTRLQRRDRTTPAS